MSKVQLHEQIGEVRREIALREKTYPGLVARGRMTQAEAAVQLSRLRAVLGTIEYLDTHSDAFRAVARDVHVLTQDPALAAVLDFFPEARIAAVRTIEPVTATEGA